MPYDQSKQMRAHANGGRRPASLVSRVLTSGGGADCSAESKRHESKRREKALACAVTARSPTTDHAGQHMSQLGAPDGSNKRGHGPRGLTKPMRTPGKRTSSGTMTLWLVDACVAHELPSTPNTRHSALTRQNRLHRFSGGSRSMEWKQQAQSQKPTHISMCLAYNSPPARRPHHESLKIDMA